MVRLVRIGDIERDRAAALLQEHHVAGRLTADEFEARVDAALRARTGVDIGVLFEDLPDPKPGSAVSTAARRASGRPWLIVALVVVALGVGGFLYRGWAGGTASTTPPSSTASATAAPVTRAPEPVEPSPTRDRNDDLVVHPPANQSGVQGDVEIVDYGFGRSDYNAAAIVIVAAGESAAGEFVTVSVNFAAADGSIIATETQMAQFNWAGQELALFVWLDPASAGAKVASIDPSVTLSDFGSSGTNLAPLPVLDAVEIKDSGYTGYDASFEFSNETGSDLEYLQAGVACYDPEGEITGGGITIAALAPANKTIRITADSLAVSQKPTSCRAFLNPSGL